MAIFSRASSSSPAAPPSAAECFDLCNASYSAAIIAGDDDHWTAFESGVENALTECMDVLAIYEDEADHRGIQYVALVPCPRFAILLATVHWARSRAVDDDIDPANEAIAKGFKVDEIGDPLFCCRRSKRMVYVLPANASLKGHDFDPAACPGIVVPKMTL